MTVSLGDLDGDQRADDASVDGSVLTLDLSTTAASPEHFLISGEYVTVAAIDVDHDGDLDLVVVSTAVSSGANVVVLVNDGRAGFQPRTPPVGVHVSDSLGSWPLSLSVAAAPGAVAPVPPASSSAPARTWRPRILRAQFASLPYRGLTSRGPPAGRV
jgi:hypothetical protein